MYTLKKSLGQHFLNDAGILARITEAVVDGHPTQLLEVGPGGGALTQHLLLLPDIDFRAVELDDEKSAYLEKKFPAIQGKLIRGSILDIPAPFPDAFHVVGNFPYNISSQILFKVLDWKEQVPRVIGMFQKEVAERVAAKPGSKAYGVISILLQAHYAVDYLFDVPPHCFTPPPQVMSGVIRLTRRNELPDFRSWPDFQRIVKAAFTQRRKTLRNGLKGILPPEVLVDTLFERRAETLSVDEFAALTHRLPARTKN